MNVVLRTCAMVIYVCMVSTFTVSMYFVLFVCITSTHMRGWTGGTLSHLPPYSVDFLPKLFFSHPTVSHLPPLVSQLSSPCLLAPPLHLPAPHPRLPALVLAARPLMYKNSSGKLILFLDSSITSRLHSV